MNSYPNIKLPKLSATRLSLLKLLSPAELWAVVLVLLLAFGISTPVKAAEEKVSSSIQIANASLSSTLSVQSRFHNNMSGHDYKGQLKLKLYFDRDYETTPNMFLGTQSFQVVVGYSAAITPHGSTFPEPAITGTLTLKYDVTEGGEIVDHVQDDLSRFDNGGGVIGSINATKANIQITSIALQNFSGVGILGNYPDNVILEAELISDHFRSISSSTPSSNTPGLDLSNRYFNLRYPFIPGAEFYEIEWLFISDGSLTGDHRSETIPVDFKDASRIRIRENYYALPLEFSRGSLIHRFRMIGMDAQGNYTYSPWNYDPNNPTISSINTDQTAAIGNNYFYHYIDNSAKLNDNLNWEYSSVFAENGLRKDQLRFFDGLGRDKQTVTLLNSDDYAVVMENEYDYAGRPALQLMPAPVASQGLQYYAANSNFSHSNHFTDTRLDQVTSGATEVPAPLDASTLVNQYYSTNNALNSEFRDWIPDANGYAYTQVQYDNNGTGRVIQQGGLGSTFALKSGRNKEYLYGRPTQSEIDRLFGNEAGSAINYSKDYIIDENKQISVTYKDGSDRVIATALTGATPANLVSIPREPETIESSLFQNKTETAAGVFEDYTIITVPVPGSYFFQQQVGSFTAPTTCNPSVTYGPSASMTLEITLTNIQTGVEEMRYGGNYTPSNMPLNIEVPKTLPQGNYILKRIIRTNEDHIASTRPTLKNHLMTNMGSIDECVPYILDNSTPCADPDCITSCEESYETEINGETYYLDADGNFYTTQTTQVTAAINTCKQACNATEEGANDLNFCEVRRGSLMADMSPGGQYFENLAPRTQYNSNGSILLNAQGQPDYNSSYHWYDWLQANLGTSANNGLATFNGLAGTSFSSWDDVRTNWQSSWADLIVDQHPEYCIYEAYCLCLATNSADVGIWHYMNRMNRDNTDAYATSDPDYPLFNPLGLPTNSSTAGGSLDNSDYMPYEQDRVDSIIASGNDILALDVDLCELMIGSPLDAMNPFITNKLQNFLQFKPTSSSVTVSHSIWYLLDDPDGIADDNGGNQAYIPQAIIDIYNQFHGAPGVTNAVLDNTSKYEFFRSVYLFYREMVLYKLVEENDLCAPSTRALDSDYDGLTAAQNGWSLTFPPNPIFDDFNTLTTAAGAQQFYDDNLPDVPESMRDCLCEELNTLWDNNNSNGDDIETYLLTSYSQSPSGSDLTDIKDDCDAGVFTNLNKLMAHPHFKTCITGDAIATSSLLPTISATGCSDAFTASALIQAENDYENAVDDYLNQLALEYRQAVADFIRTTETFTLRYTLDEHHYTLYYYDQAGNLVKTIPPQGVNPLPNSASGSDPQISDVNDYRTGASGSSYTRPIHDYQTNYRYNTLNQLIEQFTPDGGLTRFWYDALGRIVFSQNAKQQANDYYSYSLYDGLGRIAESGKCQLTINPVIGDLIDNTFILANLHSRTEISHTLYNEAYTAINANISQQYLQNRVSATMYYFSLSQSLTNANNPADDGTGNFGYGLPEQAYLYDYDVLGNVKTLYAYSSDLSTAGHPYITMAYNYDLLSGNVKQVSYEPGSNQAFYHRYHYDADNRIKYAETSPNGEIWDRDATYYYYPHGPLARVERGERLVQGEDFMYTVQGWLKSVNSSTLGTNDANNPYDAGQDGRSGRINQYVGRDAFGYSLHYFSGDYTAIDVNGKNPLASNIPSAITAKNLYNGNISAMSNQMRNNTQTTVDAHLNGYQYDQLNRISAFDTYTHSLLNSSNNAVSTSASSYGANYTYDSNGNLETLSRSNQNATTIDNFSYNYTDASVDYKRNRLVNVEDLSGYSGNDLSAGNHAYTYDAIGNLTADASEGISSIEWNLMNKITHIDQSGSDEINFEYDALGNRIQKSVTAGGNTNKTYYIRDAQGNTMATYSQPNGQSTASLSETNIFGSSRSGLLNYYSSRSTSSNATTYSRKLSNKRYELTNHLGNVLSVISDAPLLESQDKMWFEWDFSDGTTADWKKAGTTIISNYDEKLLVETTTSHGNTFQIQYLTAGTYTFQFELGNYTEAGAYPYPPQINMLVQDLTSGAVTLASLPTTAGTGVKSISFTVTGSGSRKIRMMIPVPNTVRTQPYHYTVDNVTVTEADASVYTEADVLSYQDYFPFGMTMEGRYATGDAYRYGFNGMESDDEVKGNNNSYDFGARMYDNRIGRWMSTDPQEKRGPSYSPYNFALNNPMYFMDPDGEWVKISTTKFYSDKSGGLKVKKWYHIFKKTVKIKKEIIVGDVKLYDHTGTLSEDELKGGAENLQNELIGHYNGTREGKWGDPDIEITLEFENDIQVITSLDELDNDDDLVSLVNNTSRWIDQPRSIGGSIDYRTMIMNVSEIRENAGTYPHEFTHQHDGITDDPLTRNDESHDDRYDDYKGGIKRNQNDDKRPPNYKNFEQIGKRRLQNSQTNYNRSKMIGKMKKQSEKRQETNTK